MNATLSRLFVAAVLALAAPALAAEPVLLGVDALRRDGFKPLVGKRIGLITNHTGLAADSATTIDVLNDAPGVELVRLFGPEHGIRGELDQSVIDDDVDGPTGLPIVSLYGPRRKPTGQQLADLDVLVFDIQDIGCRFYTYIATLKLAMHAAAEAGVVVVVLDRPNPIGGVVVEGPMRDGPIRWGGEESFVGCHPIPVRHGMTIGELARLFAAEGPGGRPLDLELVVVPCEGWRRGVLWDATGLIWTNPSPNMRRLTQALLYPGIGLLETTNVSVGRGTDTPFEGVGAPWIDPRALAAELNGRGLPGVAFVARRFTPESSKHAGRLCGAVEIVVTDRAAIAPVEVGMHVVHALRALHGDDWEPEGYTRLLINDSVHQALLAGAPPERLVALAEAGVEAFLKRRAAVLIYPN